MAHKFGIILLSGGLDSTTLASLIVKNDIELYALTFDYGQTHRREILSAKAIATELGISHMVVDVSFYKNLADHSALTNSKAHKLPLGHETNKKNEDIPISYVPLRNTFFLTLAAARLESIALKAIENGVTKAEKVQAKIYIAANAVDYSGYPDCRPEFYQQASQTLQKGSKLWAQHGVPFSIETPLIEMSKADIIRTALESDAPIQLTWSCYNDGITPCGQCDSCRLRARGFAEAETADPSLAFIKSVT